MKGFIFLQALQMHFAVNRELVLVLVWVWVRCVMSSVTIAIHYVLIGMAL